jgi:anti-anti-sigma factor
MAEERRLIVPGILERVPEVCDFVADAAMDVGLDERGVYHCQMAADEWCTNVIEHGYTGRGDAGQIEVSLELRPVQLSITFKDGGPPFDPTILPEPDPAQPLEDRQPGGLGWFFIRKIMDEIRYEYKGGRNHLTMVKHGLPPEKPPEPEAPFPAVTLASGARVVSPMGRWDSASGRAFEQTLARQLDAGFVRLVVDLTSVTYISSTGLKTLLTMMRKAGEKGGKLVLAGLSGRVREVFEMAGFDTIFAIMPTVEAADHAVMTP